MEVGERREVAVKREGMGGRCRGGRRGEVRVREGGGRRVRMLLGGCRRSIAADAREREIPTVLENHVKYSTSIVHLSGPRPTTNS